MGTIALGADHAGWELKESVKGWLLEQGHEVLDFGTHSMISVDYPDYALQVAEAVAAGKAGRGVLVCGSGIGMAIVANKVPGVRAAVCADADIARLAREHNDTNVLTLGGRVVDRQRALDVVRVWLGTGFAEGRHRQRLDKIAEFEGRYLDPSRLPARPAGDRGGHAEGQQQGGDGGRVGALADE